MGLGEWLSNARLQYHGYTPEYIDRQRQFLQNQQAEREARARAEQERLRLAEEAGARASDAAVARDKAEQEKDTQRRIDAVTEQLRRGVKDPLGVETLPVGVYQSIQRQVEDERTFAEKMAETERTRKTAEKQAADAESEARSMRLHTKQRAYDIANPYPERGKADKEPDVDPFVKRALTTVKPDMYMDIDPKTNQPTLNRAAWMAEVKSTADELRKLAPGAAPAPGQPEPAAAMPLTPAEQSKLIALPVADQAKFKAILASGDQARISQARARLAAAP